jgi:hypothetical protein
MNITQFNGTNATILDERYLLIEAISGGFVNMTMLGLKWKTLKITTTAIVIQALFENPLWVSSDLNFQDKLNITFTKASIDVFVSNGFNLPLEDPF